MAKKSPTPRIKDRLLSEERLIEAAELIFSKIGYDATTTRMIAQTSGVNLSLINRYFDGKYGLLLAICKKRSEEFTAGIPNYPQQENLEDEMLTYSTTVLDRYLEGINFFKVILVQFMNDPKFLKNFQETILRKEPIPEVVRRILELSKKKISIDQASSLITNLDVYIFGQVTLQYLIIGIDKNEIHESMKDFIKTYISDLR